MKTSTILFVVGSLIIVGGGVFAFTQVTKPPSEVATTTNTPLNPASAPESDTMTGRASILSLMTGAQGKSMECTFVFVGEGVRSEGTGFFVDGKVRVDSLYNGETNKQIASYMIMDRSADAMYVWTLLDGEEAGVKMSISENEKMAAQISGSNSTTNQSMDQQQISPESDVEYTCKPWSPDETVFTPPANVEFTDMTEMNKMMNDMMGGVKLPTS